jgi:hypothetical protein
MKKTILVAILLMVLTPFVLGATPTIPSVPGDGLEVIGQGQSQVLPYQVRDTNNDTLNCTLYVDLDNNPFSGGVQTNYTNITNTAQVGGSTLAVDVDGSSIYTAPLTNMYYGLQCTDGNSTVNSTVNSITFRDLLVYEAGDVGMATVNMIASFIIGIATFSVIMCLILILGWGVKKIK